jgi:hypothetical protein
VIKNGVFTPTFATAANPYVCIDQRQKTIPDSPPTTNYVGG